MEATVGASVDEYLADLMSPAAPPRPRAATATPLPREYETWRTIFCEFEYCEDRFEKSLSGKTRLYTLKFNKSDGTRKELIWTPRGYPLTRVGAGIRIMTLDHEVFLEVNKAKPSAVYQFDIPFGESDVLLASIEIDVEYLYTIQVK